MPDLLLGKHFRASRVGETPLCAADRLELVEQRIRLAFAVSANNSRPADGLRRQELSKPNLPWFFYPTVIVSVAVNPFGPWLTLTTGGKPPLCAVASARFDVSF